MPKDFTNDPRSDQPETDEQEAGSGDYRGGLDWIERRAVREGWLSIVDERMPGMVSSLTNDVTDSELEPRDRHRAFNAVSQAVNRERMYQLARERNHLAEQRFDLVTFHHQQEAARPEGIEDTNTVEGHIVNPTAIAREVMAMKATMAAQSEDE